jgi:hypothetical protein
MLMYIYLVQLCVQQNSAVDRNTKLVFLPIVHELVDAFASFVQKWEFLKEWRPLRKNMYN